MPSNQSSQSQLIEFIEWRSKFVEFGGFSYIYKVLIGFNHINLLSDHYQANSKFIGFLLIIVKTFVESALATINSQTCLDFRNTSAAIVNCIQYPSLITKLLCIVEMNLQKSQENKAVILICKSLELLQILMVYKPVLLSNLYLHENLENIIISGLLECQNESIREVIKNIFSAIAETATQPIENIELPRNYLLKILIGNLPSNYCLNCDQYFDLFNKLISICNYFDISLLNFILEFIDICDIAEVGTLGMQDKIIAEYLKTATILVDFSPENKINLSIYLDRLYLWLFETSKQESVNIQNISPKLKHQNARKAAFSLILSLCSNCPANTQKILMLLCQNHKNLSFLNSKISFRSETGYVGLENIYGGACHMNSLLQQFFMIPQIRQGILESKISTLIPLEDNLLYQLQLLFANLSESQKQYYDPINFCKAFKGKGGQSLNLSAQQDVDEFFNLLLDKLENLLNPTKQAKLFRNTIGGTFLHEIIYCEENFSYKGESEEQFFRISLDIKNKKNIIEALDDFIKEDLLEGDNKYFCEKYGQKITAKKRCLINNMSNTVIIYLKRFEFDLARMVKNKINDFFEFPMELNLKPWTKDGIENLNCKPFDYYQYKLKGVLVHSGSADSGHYYSIINGRNTGNWLKFDDRYVENFDINNLNDECFGGEAKCVEVNNQTYYVAKSAYMLIYERINPLVGDFEESIQNENEYQCKTPEICNKISFENMEFQSDFLYFDKDYFDFLKKVVEIYELGMHNDDLRSVVEDLKKIIQRFNA